MLIKPTDIILGILLFAIIVVAVSIYGEHIPFERIPKEGWAFFGGTSGTPTPADEAEGKMDAFVIGTKQDSIEEQETAQQGTEPQMFSFEVSIETEQQQNGGTDFFCGVCVGALAMNIIMAVAILVVWLRMRKRTRCKEVKL